jgi:hypothetical protein
VLLDQVHQRHQRPHIGAMPHLDLSDEKAAALKTILAKLRPEPVREPFALPKM